MASIAISTGSPGKPRSTRAWRPFAAVCLLAASALALADSKLLPPEQAFRLSARALDERTIEARFEVTDGYYLYRDKLKFALDPGMADLVPASLPPGKVKEDQFFGKVETYRGDVVVRLPLPAAAGGKAVVLVTDSQGCADLGVCYPVSRQKLTLQVPAPGKGPGPQVEAAPRKKSWFN
jgi:thiol:disulfide interchange protein DsbD